ncbi:hypothetical protein LSUE1_G006083 [Lachnellula suecica]|uniref:Uncharacterized protein n=1 Tax=Lachnellula suecica TaxID=602035 RepID=A0A8T9BZK6_9HELO|nr:hypothetical protein LSUE1_G006083 [Lachnellula suecica]
MTTYDSNHFMPVIAREDFEIGCMKPLSYSREEISKAIVDNVKRLSSGDMSPRQVEAVARMKYLGTVNVMQPENLEDFHKWFGFFNDLYFGGLLKGYCRIETYNFKDMGKRVDGHCRGYFHIDIPGQELDPRFRKETVDGHIAILRYDVGYYREIGSSHFTDPFTRWKNYFDTLLHEMLHAVDGIYGYYCLESCCAEVEETWGHDIYWQAAAQALEDSKVLGWYPQLGRTESLCVDVEGGYILPDEIVLRSLGLDITQILTKQRQVKAYFHEEEVRPPAANRCIRGDWIVDA